MRISDMRLFQIMKHLQSFSFPSTKIITDVSIETWTTASDAQQTLETIDGITEEKPVDINAQELVQIEANFELPKVRFELRIGRLLINLFRLILFSKKQKIMKNIHFFIFHSYLYVYKHSLKLLILNFKHH